MHASAAVVPCSASLRPPASAVLARWLTSSRPPHPPPAQLEVRPGEEGRREFMSRIRSIFGLAEDDEVALSFGCKVRAGPGPQAGRSAPLTQNMACWAHGRLLAWLQQGSAVQLGCKQLAQGLTGALPPHYPRCRCRAWSPRSRRRR